MTPATTPSARTWVNDKIPGPGPIPKLFDNGGWLTPGATTAVNATGHPEAILTAKQWADVRSYLPVHTTDTTRDVRRGTGVGQPAVFQLYDADRHLIGTMRGIAAEQGRSDRDWSTSMDDAGMGADR